MNLQRRWHALKAWGWPGAASLALLAVAGGAAGYEAYCRGLQRQASVQVRQLEVRLRALAKAPVVAPASTRAGWLASLPVSEARQRRLADLLEAAIREGLNATHTEYQLGVDQAAGLERLRITMPIQGSYAQIRQFVGTALAHDPALSLDSLRLSRSSPQGSQIEAELVWSVHGKLAPEGS